MTNAVKAIETVYDGRRFRSRLEARWAVFFNQLGLKYEYEKEGFQIPPLFGYSTTDSSWSGPDVSAHRYLPDFWLPDLQWWIEIKPEWNEDYRERMRAVFYYLNGDNYPGYFRGCVMWGVPDVEEWQSFQGFYRHYGLGERERDPATDKHLSRFFDPQRVEQAREAALSARFEHGEKPPTTMLHRIFAEELQ